MILVLAGFADIPEFLVKRRLRASGPILLVGVVVLVGLLLGGVISQVGALVGFFGVSLASTVLGRLTDPSLRQRITDAEGCVCLKCGGTLPAAPNTATCRACGSPYDLAVCKAKWKKVGFLVQQRPGQGQR